MSMTPRIAAISTLVLSAAFVAVGQPSTVDPDRIRAWTAPPFWSPMMSTHESLLAEGEARRLGAEAAEGVPTPPLAFTGITPCRIADTRDGNFSGFYGPPALAAASIRNFPLTGQCGIPAAAQAVSLNVTIVNAQGPGFISLGPQGAPLPVVSTLNYVAGDVLANAAVVSLGSGGGITVLAGGFGTDLILDTNGYYAPFSAPASGVSSLNGLSGAVTLAAGSNVTITPAGNTLTIAATGGPSGWSLTGNAGTTPGTNFLGTTDNRALELKVFNQRVMRYEPTTQSNVPNIIGGSNSNTVTFSAVGITIGGGGVAGTANRVTDSYGTVGGGRGNRAGDDAGTTSDRLAATVGGGHGNIASGLYSVVAGGFTNTASAATALVSGGGLNVANAGFAAVGGGGGNTAGGDYSTVPGGNNNRALGAVSFAAGTGADALHDGTFVWSGGGTSRLTSTAGSQFVVRSAGGIWLGNTGTTNIPAGRFINTSMGAYLTTGGTWTNSSDVGCKTDFEEIDGREVLERLASLPISRWSYAAEGPSVRHLGPTGQAFAAAFGLGGDERAIATVDADGVALTAIQALYEISKQKDLEIEALKRRLSKLEANAQ